MILQCLLYSLYLSACVLLFNFILKSIYYFINNCPKNALFRQLRSGGVWRFGMAGVIVPCSTMFDIGIWKILNNIKCSYLNICLEAIYLQIPKYPLKSPPRPAGRKSWSIVFTW